VAWLEVTSFISICPKSQIYLVLGLLSFLFQTVRDLISVVVEILITSLSYNSGFYDFRYEHPLLIEGRDKSEWVLPITVHAPPPGTSGAHTRSEKPFSLEPLWVHN
jgi:hypothetical protein